MGDLIKEFEEAMKLMKSKSKKEGLKRENDHFIKPKEEDDSIREPGEDD